MKVHSIESLAALDGAGLRYAVFLAGCPLRCSFCHNPDTQNTVSGTDYTPQELFSRIIRYVPYFRAGGGGVTFSGGEPLLWADEILKLGKMLGFAGINYTIDTSGCLRLTPPMKAALRGAELVICDLKHPDDVGYRDMTGGELSFVREFFGFLADANIRTWVRTVIIPGVNDSRDTLEKYIEFYRTYCAAAEKYELLAFHTMGFFKYEQLGIENKLADTPPLDIAALVELQEYVDGRLAGVKYS